MENQHRHRENRVHEKNFAVPDIIPLTEDNDSRPPTGAPVSDDKSSVDYLLVHPPA